MKRHCVLLVFTSVALFCSLECLMAAGVQPSKWVYPSYTGDLIYAADTNGVRINDFSDCGYRRGEVALPNVSNLVEFTRWVVLSPAGGGTDDTPIINNALAQVGAMMVNSNGFRGVVYLQAGNYEIADPGGIRLTNSGVVLKGVPRSFSTLGTRLSVTSPEPFSLFHVDGDGERADVGGSESYLVETLVPAGTRTFLVNTTNGYQVGDSIVVVHQSSAAWIHAMDMDQLGEPWAPGGFNSEFERVITRIEGNWITVDAPIPQTFEARYGYGSIKRFAWTNRIQNCGVEDIFASTAYAHEETEGGNPLVEVTRATDVWVRNINAAGHFSSVARVGNSAKFVTVAECTGSDYPTPDDHHFRYNFYLDKTHPQFVLMRDCTSYRSRHSFVTGARVPGPNAFVRCAAFVSDDETGAHERWATGCLFDDTQEHGNEFSVQNRGNSGGGNSFQGWTGGFMAVWNCYAEEGFRVRSPPTACNWLIGSDGEKMESKHGCWHHGDLLWSGPCWCVGADPSGIYDQSGEGSDPVQMRSLYYAQLQQRLKWPGSRFREYRLGDIDQFTSPSSVYDLNSIPLDTNWWSDVQFIAGGSSITNRFDLARTNQVVAFTFNCPLAPGEQIVAAWLTMGLKFAGASLTNAGNDVLYLDSVDTPHLFSSYGWNFGPNTVSVTIPIWAGDLQDGKLNVALAHNTGVDFAVLNLQVAPILTTSVNTETPIDTYVRGGSSHANVNYSAEAALAVKEDDDDEFRYRTLLYWNLGEESGPLADAKVRLYCIDTAQPGNENSASLIPSTGWNPNSVTWNTQPVASPPLAYWVPNGPGSFVEFSVTPEVRAALAGDKKFSLCIQGADDFGNAGNVSYASLEDPNSAHWPRLILSYTNSPPSIIAPTNRTMIPGVTPPGSVTPPLPVTIGDAETVASALSLSAVSSDPLVIDNADIIFGGSGSNRTVILQNHGGIGSARITLTVSDGSLSPSASFIVQVGFLNTAPSITPITNKVTFEDIPLSVLFTIADSQSMPDDLSVNLAASNTQLIPTGSLRLLPHDQTGSRTLVFTPPLNAFGTGTVNVTVSDGFLVATQSFVILVQPVEDAPAWARLITPASGDHLLPGSNTLVKGEAFDAETNVVRLDFYSLQQFGPDLFIGSSSNAPYTVTWSHPNQGTFNLYAVAIDSTGLSAVSPFATVTVSTPVTNYPVLFAGIISNSVAVFWPDTVSSNALQTTTNLAPPVQWSPVVASPELTEGGWLYFVPPNERQRFYRLGY